jgi:tRNA-binding protein
MTALPKEAAVWHLDQIAPFTRKSLRATLPLTRPQLFDRRAADMPPLKSQITYDDFARLDIRIGKVVEVQPFPRARNPSWKVGVDVGAERIMWSSAQITNYEPADLVGSLVVCVCNFAPKNIAGFTSELLILGAENSEGKVIVLSPRSEVAAGEAVY